MSSILSLSSAQVQTIFAEEMTITDGLSESENSDVIENENLQIEDQTETVDADNETIPDCIENQEVEVLQNDSEFSDGASENTEGLKEFSENNTRVTQSEYNGFLYDITDENEVTITGYDGDVENGLIIPDTIQDYPVTEIGDSAFAGKDIKGELKLPEKLKRIGEYAFSGCYNLTGNLEFPSTLKQIGRDAFKGCSGFTGNLILPEGLKTIGEEAFYRCTGYYYDEEEEENDKGLSGKLTLPSTVTDIGDNAFNKDRWERLAVLKGNMTSYTQTSSKDFPIVLGRTYTYTVRSYTSTEKTYGLYDSSGKKIQVTLAAPQLETVKSVSSGLKIQWKKVAGASAYVVYRCENGKWELLTRTKRLYYIDSKAQKGITYRYAVKAYSTVDRKNIYSSKSNTKSGRY